MPAVFQGPGLQSRALIGEHQPRFMLQRRRIAMDWLFRALAIAIYCMAVSNITRALLLEPTRWTLMALLVSEGFTLILILCARQSLIRDASPVAVFAVVYSVFYYVLFDTGRTTPLIPEFFGVLFYIVGAACQFSAKATLGRSFGILPAFRAFVGSGPYRYIRHPMYLGYLIGQTGFVRVNFSLLNLCVLLGIFLALGLRIGREEAVLSNSPEYVEYRERVPWRLVPRIF
jgi:protein-S-isoprenylcysteine O-methyltransferase Ste14